MNYATFTGQIEETTRDRDGAKVHLYTTGIAIRFEADHTLYAWEKRGAYKKHIPSTGANFTGTWSTDDNQKVTFELKRQKKPDQINLGLPDGENASDYYYYPESGTASDLEEAQYTAKLKDNSLLIDYVAYSSIREMELKEGSSGIFNIG